MDSLDDRVMDLADRMEKAGHGDDADALRSHTAYLRETFRGADVREDLAEDLQAVADNAQAAVAAILRYQDRL